MRVYRGSSLSILQGNMFGSFPCYPGFKDRQLYLGTHFYCSSCEGIVSPREVKVAVIDGKGTSVGFLSVLRCKHHMIKGTYPSGPITTLWGLHPVDSLATNLREQMYNVCVRVRNLDILSILSVIFGGVCCFLGLVFGLIVIHPVVLGFHHWFLPAILLSVGIGMFAIGMGSMYLSRLRVREWLGLSKDYIARCELMHVQGGTEKYAVLTDFPPSCHPLSGFIPAPQGPLS